MLAYHLHRKVSTTRQKVEPISSITAFGGPDHHRRETKISEIILYYILYYNLRIKDGGWLKVKTCPICKGYGKLPVTQVPKAETDCEETACDCPTCKGKGKLEDKGNESDQT